MTEALVPSGSRAGSYVTSQLSRRIASTTIYISFSELNTTKQQISTRLFLPITLQFYYWRSEWLQLLYKFSLCCFPFQLSTKACTLCLKNANIFRDCEHQREELRRCITAGEGPVSHYENIPFITDVLTVQVIETVRVIPIFPVLPTKK